VFADDNIVFFAHVEYIDVYLALYQRGWKHYVMRKLIAYFGLEFHMSLNIHKIHNIELENGLIRFIKHSDRASNK